MQLLIDTSQETPKSLRRISSILLELAIQAAQDAPADPSINGPSEPVTLTLVERSIDPQPHFLDKILTDPAQMDPAEVFKRQDIYKGVIHQNVLADVPAGTPEAPLVVQSAGTAPTAAISTPPPALALVAAAPPAPVAQNAVASVAANSTQTAPAPPTGPAITAGVVSTDSDGLPWDARVHSETRKLNADGTWRYRRNLDPVLKAQVFAELKAAYGGQATLAVTAPTAPPAPPVSLQPGPGHHVPAPPAAVPLPPGIPMGLPNAPQPPVVPATNFRELMTKVNQALASGRLTQVQLTAACQACNLDSITALAAQPAMVALVDAQVNDILGAVAA